MLAFFSLLLVHLVADFFLQKDQWIKDKIEYKEKSFGLFKHVLVHLVLNAIVLALLIEEINLTFFIVISTIVISHYLIDIWKCYQTFSIKSFLADQFAHVLILLVISLYLSNMQLSQVIEIGKTYLTIENLAILSAYIFLSRPLSFIIQLSLAQYTRALHQYDENQGLQNAGEWIGILERYLVLTLVLLGQYTGVGFLLAAKSVFRFGDMRQQKDRKLTEYIMLGTLLSIGTALMVGIAVKQF